MFPLNSNSESFHTNHSRTWSCLFSTKRYQRIARTSDDDHRTSMRAKQINSTHSRLSNLAKWTDYRLLWLLLLANERISRPWVVCVFGQVVLFGDTIRVEVPRLLLCRKLNYFEILNFDRFGLSCRKKNDGLHAVSLCRWVVWTLTTLKVKQLGIKLQI